MSAGDQDYTLPAFPQTFQAEGAFYANLRLHAEGGMTLRDWFAGQALVAMTGSYAQFNDALAKRAYDVADAMLKARAKP